MELYEINCEEVLVEIEYFIDGEVDADRSARLAAHLSRCGFCLDHADFRRKLKELVRAKCRSEQTPEHLLARIRDTIRAQRPPAPPAL